MFDKFVKDIKDFKASVSRYISPGGIIMSGVSSSFHFDFFFFLNHHFISLEKFVLALLTCEVNDVIERTCGLETCYWFVGWVLICLYKFHIYIYILPCIRLSFWEKEINLCLVLGNGWLPLVDERFLLLPVSWGRVISSKFVL